MTTLILWAELIPIDRASGAEVTLRVTSHNDAVATAAGGVAWRPAITRRPGLTRDMFDGAFSGRISADAGEMDLDLGALGAIPALAWARRRVSVWAGQPGDDPLAASPLLLGRVDSAVLREGRVTLRLSVDDAWMDAPLLSSDFAGTGGAEGGADLAGQPKPLAVGAARGVSPVTVDPSRSIMIFDGYGLTAGVVAAFDRASAFPASAGDFADYATLEAAIDDGTVPAGFYATSAAAGAIGFGAPPDGPVTVDLAAKPAIATPGEVMAALAALAGAAPTAIDQASLDALDAALQALDPSASIAIAHYQRQQVTARQLLQQIAQSCNAVAGVDWSGKFVTPRVVAPTGGAPALTLRSDGSARPAVTNVEELEVGPPFWRLKIGADRNHTPHSFDQIAFGLTLTDRGDFDPTVTYREGDIVRGPDGRRYLYTNPTPTAGTAPPDEAFWSLFEAGAKYGDGTPIDDLKPLEPDSDATASHTEVTVDNPRLELGDVSWSNRPAQVSVVEDAANAFDGAWVMRFNADGLTRWNTKNFKLIPTKPGERWLSTCVIKGGDAGSGAAFAQAIYRQADGGTLATPSGGNDVQLESVPAGSAAFVMSRSVSVCPDDGAFVQAAITSDISVTGTWFADRFTLSRHTKDADIDALKTRNPPAEAGADATAGKSLGVLVDRVMSNIDDSGGLATRDDVAFGAGGLIRDELGGALRDFEMRTREAVLSSDGHLTAPDGAGAPVNLGRQSQILATDLLDGKQAGTIRGEHDSHLDRAITFQATLEAADEEVWVRLLTVAGGAAGRSAFEVEVQTPGSGMVPGVIRFQISVNWNSDITIVQSGGLPGSRWDSVRVVADADGNRAFFDVRAKLISNSTVIRLSARPMSFDNITLSETVVKGATVPTNGKSCVLDVTGESLLATCTNINGGGGANIDATGRLRIGGKEVMTRQAQLAAGILMSQGTEVPRPGRFGLESGPVRDGDVVTFQNPYLSAPKVTFNGGIQKDGFSPAYVAENLSVTGYTASLKIESQTTGTTQESSISEVQISGLRWEAGIDLDAKPKSGQATWNYVVDGSVEDTDGDGFPDQFTILTFEFFLNEGGGWVSVGTAQIAANSIGQSVSTTKTVGSTVTAHGGREFAIELISQSGAAGGLASLTSVTWDEDDSTPTVETATPAGTPDMEFESEIGS